MENIRFTALLKDGTAVPGNVEATNVFEAAREYLESIECGDLKVNPEDVIAIIDIPG